MHIIFRQTCRVCGSPHLLPVIDLGLQYLQGSFLKDGVPPPPLRKIPTCLVRCDVSKSETACGLLQLAHTLPPEILYANYWYRSGTNATMREHLKEIVSSVLAISGLKSGCVLDIGCNDGTLLTCYPPGFTLIGVDPSDIALEVPPSVRLVNALFPSPALFGALEGKKVDIVTSIAMFYDLEDPCAFAKSVADVLTPTGIWVMEMSYLPLMLDRNSFDTICHEHLEYYSLAVIENILRRVGLRLFKAELTDINGGSIRCYITNADNMAYDTIEAKEYLHRLRVHEFEQELDSNAPYQEFQKRIERLRDDLQAKLRKLKSAGKRIHVYGASTKGNVLLQWCGIGADVIDCAADRNPIKNGARTLGTNIPIVLEEESRALKPDAYLVLPWHFKKEFLERERAAIQGGTMMIFPLPHLTVVDASNLDEVLSAVKKNPFDDDLPPR
ncbi:MAG: class I SAM-dependent methyltransferase [Alphaproteobacteria bacterium]|nr:class I SAM-dependent methyltransferase [Alphaproteobacteria bacterium]